MPPQHQAVVLSHEELEKLCEKAINGAFVKMGMSAGEPLDMQKDFAFIRSLRESSEALRTKGLLTLVGILVSAIAAAIWIGVKSAVHK